MKMWYSPLILTAAKSRVKVKAFTRNDKRSSATTPTLKAVNVSWGKFV
jgi:hypothetical protein